MRVEVVRTDEEFALLHEEWSDLLGRLPFSNPFLSHEWMFAWWVVYGHGELYIITCRSSGSYKLVGIFPLFLSKSCTMPPMNVFRFLGSEQVSSDFLSILAQDGMEAEVYRACFERLHEDIRLWDMLELNDVDSVSPFYNFINDNNLAGLDTFRLPSQICPYLPLPDTWEELLNTLSRKKKQRIGYYRRALEKKGPVLLEMVNDPADLHDALRDLACIRRDRFAQKGISLKKVNEKYFQFHDVTMFRFLRCGYLALFFLCVNGERVAFLYSFVQGTNIFFYQTGFLQHWKNQSVGFVLLSMVIEWSISQKMTVFHFLRGQEEYKYNWTNKNILTENIQILNKSYKNFFYIKKTHFFHSSRILIKKLVPKILYKFNNITII